MFESESFGRACGLVFVLTGLVLLGFAVRSAFEVASFLRTAIRAEGNVTSLNAGGSHPQIHFIAPNGGEVSYPQGGLIFGFQPGDRVRVLFSADDPAGTASVDAVGAVWFTPLLLGGLGTLFLIVGTVTLLTTRSHN